MKQVWQTEDGNVFNTSEDALKWEAQQNYIDTLAGFLFAEVDCVGSSYDAKEIAEYLVCNYDIVPR